MLVSVVAILLVVVVGGLVGALASAGRPAGAAEACHPDAPAEVTDYVPGHAPASMKRLGCNADVAVYGDGGTQALPSGRTDWVLPFVTSIWRYEKDAYGDCAVERTLPAPIGPDCARFGEPKPLMVLLNLTGPGSAGGTVTNRFDAFAGFRNTLSANSGDWAESAVLRDVLSHESCHIVEGASQGVHESPAFQTWGDSKWAEYCQFDLYLRTGRAADAGRVFDSFVRGDDSLPAGAAHANWFRNWFFPLWSAGGRGPAVAERFFGLLSRYFPTRTENDGRNEIYTRRMTTGEFVHFMSGAAGTDLGPRAAQAFNTGFDKAGLAAARAAFPQVTYPAAPCRTGDEACPAVRVTAPEPQTSAVGVAVSLPVAASNPTGAGGFRYSARGLPAGLSINSATGVISGTPTARGSSYVAVKASGTGANAGVTSFRWNVADWTGTLVNAEGRCADDSSSGTSNGNPMQTWACNGTGAQSFQGLDGQIVVLGVCLRPQGTAAGSPVVGWACDGNSVQKWQLEGSAVRHVPTGLCLSSPDGTQGRLTLAACSAAPGRVWTVSGTPPAGTVSVTRPGAQETARGVAASLQIAATVVPSSTALTYSATGLPPGLGIAADTGRITGAPTLAGAYTVTVTVRTAQPGAAPGTATFPWSVYDYRGQLIDAEDDCVDNNSSHAVDGNPVHAWPCNGTAAQVVTTTGSTYAAQGHCLQPAGDRVVISTCTGAAAQSWAPLAADGTIRHSSGLCLTSPAPYEQLRVRTCDGSDKQVWHRP